jgi:ferredoxin
MADHTQRWEDNVAGRWYVDRTCILCSLCSELAPRSFKESTDGDHDIVYRQPATPEEEAAAEQAKAQCPVESIGCDG